MPEKNDIPIFRNLDGVSYRVVRDGIHVNRCFSDLSAAEQDVIMAEYNTCLLYTSGGVRAASILAQIAIS